MESVKFPADRVGATVSVVQVGQSRLSDQGSRQHGTSPRVIAA
jgi:hypothetical protein